jgi:lysophospholipase L1-like esterase
MGKKRLKTISEVRSEISKMFRKVKNKKARAKAMREIWKRYKPSNPDVKARPPAEWMAKMLPRIKAQYPKYSKRRLMKIISGIWHDYSDATKRRLIKKYA